MHPTCLNGKACGHNDPLCLISLPLCFSAGLFLGVPQKGRRKENNCCHGARSITSARARRTAKGAYFHNTNQLNRKPGNPAPQGCTPD